MPYQIRKGQSIPYEILNAREWDLTLKLPVESSEEEEEKEYEDDFDDDDWEQSPPSSVGVRSNINPAKDAQSSGATENATTLNGAVRRGQSAETPRAQVKQQENTPGRPRRPKVILNGKRDNVARAAFRRRLDPNGSFVLHKDCHEIDPNRQRMYAMFEEMGVRLGSFIRPPQDIHDRELLIWGNPKQITSTKTELRYWLARSEEGPLTAPKGKGNFSKELSNVTSRYKNLQKKIARDAAIYRFQQVPEAKFPFRHTGVFKWQLEEVKPEDILGQSLEAYDPLRFEFECHIVFDSDESVFKIFTDSNECVHNVIQRIEGTIREYIARSHRALALNLVEPPDISIIRKEVRVLPGQPLDAKTSEIKIPVLTGAALALDARSAWPQQRAELVAQNKSRVEQSLRRVIPSLAFYRGQIRIRVLFGTFALSVFRWPEGATSISLDEFTKSMGFSGTKGIMIRDLHFTKDASTIMAKICKATNILQPMENDVLNLDEVTPFFGARFEFVRYGRPSVQLEVEMKHNPAIHEGLYEKTLETWKRLDRKDNSMPLDLFMIRLGGGASWKFQVSTENNLDATRIDPKMEDFASSVKLKRNFITRNELTGQKVFDWNTNPLGNLQPTTFEQKTALRYRLVNAAEWIFEIARYDSYMNAAKPNDPVTTNWGASMWNTEWDSTLSENHILGIGESAKWHPGLATFFPSWASSVEPGETDPGVEQFLRNVQMVADCLDGVKEVTPHLRG